MLKNIIKSTAASSLALMLLIAGPGYSATKYDQKFSGKSGAAPGGTLSGAVVPPTVQTLSKVEAARKIQNYLDELQGRMQKELESIKIAQANVGNDTEKAKAVMARLEELEELMNLKMEFEAKLLEVS